MNIIGRVSNRLKKEWQPRTVEGNLSYHNEFRDIDFSLGPVALSDLIDPEVEINVADFSKNFEISLKPTADSADIKRYFKHAGPWPLNAAWSYGNGKPKRYRIRANMMQQPFYNRNHGGDGTSAGQHAPFDSFRRINSLVISGIPAFRRDGYLDALTGFTYTNIRTLWGMGRKMSPYDGEGVKLLAIPLSNGDITGFGVTHKFGFIDEAYKLDLNLRLSSTYPTYGCGILLQDDFYQNNGGEGSDASGYMDEHEEDLSGRARRRYANTFYNTFYARVDYEYLKGTNGSISLAHPRQDAADGPGYSTFETDYIAQRDYVDSKELNYRFTRTSCGRLPPYGALVVYDKSNHAWAVDGVATTMTIPTINAGSQASAVPGDGVSLTASEKILSELKTHWPRPADGRILNFEYEPGYSVTLPATKDCTAEVGAPGGDQPNKLGGIVGTMDDLRARHADALTSGVYTMYWDNNGRDYAGRGPHINRYVHHMKRHFGSPVSSFINAYIHMRTSLRALNTAWTYDDAPREARIRMQKAKKLSPESFSALQQGYIQETDLAVNSISFESDTDESPEEY